MSCSLVHCVCFAVGHISRQRDRQWLWFSDCLLHVSAPDVGIFCQLRCSYLPGFAAVQKRKRSAIPPAEFLEIVRELLRKHCNVRLQITEREARGGSIVAILPKYGPRFRWMMGGSVFWWGEKLRHA